MSTITKIQDGPVANAGIPIHAQFFRYWAGQMAIWHVDYEVADNSTDATMGDIAFGLQTRAEATEVSLYDSHVQLLGCRVTFKVPPHGLNVLAGVAISDAVGSQTSGTAGGQVAPIVSYKTAKAGPKFRGRTFMPFIPNVFVDKVTGGPTVTYQNTCLQLFQIGTGVGGGAGVVVLDGAGDSIVLDQHLYNRAMTLDTPVVDCQVREYLGTQKKRGDLGKLNPPFIPL